MGPFWLWKPLESFWFEVYSLMGRETRRGRKTLLKPGKHFVYFILLRVVHFYTTIEIPP